ncbi:PBECR4 domain-containing protein [Lacticaseibacillus parakribbianus]|uniref:PBECR4 domain-containing protein n=1 Tax=Lacticaseibacillus parakribbianus TaxID=2970927 RepID=UPI0021CB2DF1|nr:PBECR4 domain-containing protein [Lacticaseibacillus parakribbianus]
MAITGGFRQPTVTEQRQLHRYLPQVMAAASFCDRELIGFELIYHTKNSVVSMQVEQANFSHLCGLSYGTSGREFSRLAKRKRLSLDKLRVKSDGTSLLKLRVLDQLPRLIEPGVRLVTNGSLLMLKYDFALRTHQAIIGLTLSAYSGSRLLTPNSLLNLKTMRQFPAGVEVTHLSRIAFRTAKREDLW